MNRNSFLRSLFAGMGLSLIAAALFGQDPAKMLVADGPRPAMASEGPVSAPLEKVSDRVREHAGRSERLQLLLALSGRADATAMESIKARYRDRIQYEDRQAKVFAGEKDRHAAVAQRDRLRLMERKELVSVRAAQFQTQQERVSRMITGLGGRVLRLFNVTNSLFVEVPASALASLEADPEITRIEWNELKDTNLGNSAKILGAPAFWNQGNRGGTQVVAVIDSGLAPHPGFDGLPVNMVSMLDGAMSSSCLDPTKSLSTGDADGHGTHVAGIVAAQHLPGIPDATGVAPGVAGLIAVRVGAPGKGGRDCPAAVITTADILNAVQHVVEQTPATVVNISIGATTRIDDGLENWVIDSAADLFDVAFVISAGNSGRDSGPQLGGLSLSYNGISVANIDTQSTLTRSDDVINPSSSRGPTPAGRRKPDIAAPGTEIASLFLDGKVATMTGTSMAAPHIAGAIALLLDAGLAGPREAKALLLNSSDRSGWARDWGWGGAHLENAFRQRTFVESGVLGAGTSKYYRLVVDGSAKATLVWNRRIDGISPDGKKAFGDFRDLNLLAYEETSNRLVDSSSSRIDNVEQIGLRGEGSALLKVSHLSNDAGREPFALAFSNGTYEEVRPGNLSLQCSAPGEIVATVTYRVNCAISNSGALPVFGLTFRPVLPAGFRSTSVSPVARIQPEQQLTFSFDVTAPVTAVGTSPVPYSIQVSGVAYGDEHRVISSLQTRFKTPEPQDCTPVVSPANGTLLLQPNAQYFVVKLEFPLYRPEHPGVCAWSIVDSGSWISFAATPRGTNNGQVTVSVSAAPVSSRLLSRQGELRITIGTVRYSWKFHQLYAK